MDGSLRCGDPSAARAGRDPMTIEASDRASSPFLAGRRGCPVRSPFSSPSSSRSSTIAAAEAPLSPCRPFGSLRDGCPAPLDVLYQFCDFPCQGATYGDDEASLTKAWRTEPDLQRILASAASKAARNFGGDIGRSRNLSPVASAIALATAAIGGTIGTSPTPRAPNGCRGFGTSIRIVSIIGMSEQTGTR